MLGIFSCLTFFLLVTPEGCVTFSGPIISTGSSLSVSLTISRLFNSVSPLSGCSSKGTNSVALNSSTFSSSSLWLVSTFFPIPASFFSEIWTSVPFSLPVSKALSVVSHCYLRGNQIILFTIQKCILSNIKFLNRLFRLLRSMGVTMHWCQFNILLWFLWIAVISFFFIWTIWNILCF